uniref:Transposase n=1 Tax=viral metagenome TaxID=1070528 RepID=A0A6M3K2H6_9ZZZZ
MLKNLDNTMINQGDSTELRCPVCDSANIGATRKSHKFKCRDCGLEFKKYFKPNKCMVFTREI